METEKVNTNDPVLGAMFKVGAHYGYAKSRRHPSVKPFIFGVKNKVEIFDLEKTKALLEDAKEFIKKKASEGKQILFVSSKHEALAPLKDAASAVDMPYVDGRWIGGTLTNFAVIRGRVDLMLDLKAKKEKGELAQFTKKERLLISRDVERLETLFEGLSSMKKMPGVLFVVDPGKEHIAVAEAKKMGIPVVALLGSDCDMTAVDYPIAGNDSSKDSIKFFLDEIVSACKEGKSAIKTEVKETKKA